MKKYIAAAGVVVAVIGGAAACGSSGNSNDAGGDHVVAVADEGPPTLKVGQTAHVKTNEYSDDYQTTSKGSADVTLKSVKEYSEDDVSNVVVKSDLTASQELAVVTLKIDNTGGRAISMTPYTGSITWTGDDGKVSNVEIGYLADDKRVPDDLSGTTTLEPGEHKEGATVLVIPNTQPGELHFNDDTGKKLFDVSTEGIK
ncbi:hypothetical protein ACWD2L_05735 [Streptomyces sp. NPDC002754]